MDAIVGHRRKTVADSHGEFPMEAFYRRFRTGIFVSSRCNAWDALHARYLTKSTLAPIEPNCFLRDRAAPKLERIINSRRRIKTLMQLKWLGVNTNGTSATANSISRWPMLRSLTRRYQWFQLIYQNVLRGKCINSSNFPGTPS